jgi:hypothetical protein
VGIDLWGKSKVIKVIPMDEALAGSEDGSCWESLKLHKVKFVRIRVILWPRKRKSHLNRNLLGGSFPLGSWRCNQG